MVKVTAVRTTGIYCRAGCPARPHQVNTVPYRSQVAAEAAGYRACLRCRPDLEPGESVGADAPYPVRRAVDLVAHGYLDTHTESDLAAFVGYSARHLRRLFLEHVGATPDAVGRSQRAHFARKLLDDTDLALADIAAASGFSSARQLSRVVTEVFGFAPSRLRGGQKGARGDVDGGFPLMLGMDPSSVRDVIGHLQPRCVPGVEHTEGFSYARTFEHFGHPGVLEIDASDHEARQVAAVVHLPSYSGLVSLVERTRRLFGFDLDLDEARSVLADDELLGELVGSSAPLVPGFWDRFETAVRIVVGQQVSVVGGSTLAGRVAESCGRPVAGVGFLGLQRLFPSPEQLAEADLSGLGMPSSRAQTIIDLAGGVASGEIGLDGEPDELRSQLMAVRGVGPWTAEMVCLRVARDLDAFPSSDLVLRDAVGRLIGQDRPSQAVVAAVAERWRPFRGVAATVLWNRSAARY